MPEHTIAALTLEFRKDGEPDGAIIRVNQGQTVDIPEVEVERIRELEEATGGILLVPDVFESFEEFSAYRLDVYRGLRGDTQAVARATSLAEARGGGIVNLSESPGAGSSLAAQIEGGLNADDTIALAGGDAGKAAEVLVAEREATGGKPRKGVVKALTALINED